MQETYLCGMLGITRSSQKSPDLLPCGQSVVLCIDMQERLLPAMDCPETTESACVRLLKGAQLLGVPVVATEQYPKGLGPTVSSVVDAFPSGTAPHAKTSFSVSGCVAAMDELQHLVEAGRSRIVVCGVEAHVCVLQSVLDLCMLDGAWIYVVADAVSSRKVQDRELALVRMRAGGAHIVTSEMVLFEWLGASGSPEFKEISRLVK